MFPDEWLDQAANRLRSYLHSTPVSYDAQLDLYLKWESHQPTGSFKVRGALNKILALTPEELRKGLVTASAGNHGQGVALAAQHTGARVIVFSPDHATPEKITAMRRMGADVHLVAGGYALAEQTALAFAQSSQMTWVSPYNDSQVIAGQGTIGLELLDVIQEQQVKAVVVPAGGGGLVSGIGAALTRCRLRPRLVAVQSEASPFMYHLYQHGSQVGVDEFPSLADGLAGAVEEGSLTIPLIKTLVDEFVLVSEEEIARAMAYAAIKYNECIEGSAAVGLAAVLSGRLKAHPALAVMTGKNVQAEVFTAISQRYQSVINEEYPG